MRFIVAAVLACFSANVFAQTDISEASLEQLMELRVTSVSKREQQMSRTAASVYVLTEEDIRRSGANTIPDLLRMVPGMNVARIDANTWAVSIRGFNSRYANKVLVLIDGRTVYTPSFSGVFWDHQDVPLEDIERIEVIRGPGSTVWGANAVNGVINIITKSSKATRGCLITAAGGSDLNASGLVQHGGNLSTSATYRTFARYSRFAAEDLPDGRSAGDGWDRLRGGFRTDWELSKRDSVLLEGDLFKNYEGQTRWDSFIPTPLSRQLSERFGLHGGNILGRWNRQLEGGSELKLHVYYDGYRRHDLGVLESLDSADIDFQHHVVAGERHEIVWGIGYRRNTSGLAPGHDIGFTPPVRKDSLYSAFFQDEMRVAGSVWLTLGSRLEHNAYTGFEYEPSVRLAWTPSPHQTVWMSVSRAIRQPSRLDTSANITLASLPAQGGIPVAAHLSGSSDFQAEQLHDAEIGYRSQVTSRISLDIDAFGGVYRDLETVEPLTPVTDSDPTLRIVLPRRYGNGARGHLYGGEASAVWSLSQSWKLSGGYSLTRVSIHPVPASNDNTSQLLHEGHSPRHAFLFRSQLNLPHRIEFDNALYWTGPMPMASVSARARFDTRIGWKVGQSTTLSIVGQDLCQSSHVEFGNAFAIVGAEQKRSVYGQVSWRF